MWQCIDFQMRTVQKNFGAQPHGNFKRLKPQNPTEDFWFERVKHAILMPVTTIGPGFPVSSQLVALVCVPCLCKWHAWLKPGDNFSNSRKGVSGPASSLRARALSLFPSYQECSIK
jgi:hypothetical protein